MSARRSAGSAPLALDSLRGSPSRHTARAGWGRELGATFALAWPLVLSNLANMALATIDVVLIGRLSPQALAAAALATTLFNAVMITATGLVTAVSPMIATEHGRRSYAVREIRRTVRQGAWAAAAICLPAWLFLWHADGFLRAIGQEPELAALAGTYLRALMWALLPILVLVVLRLFTSALGRPGWCLAISLVALPVNGVLAWLLIFGHLGLPRLGLIGAGVATSLTGLIGLIIMAGVLLRHRRFRRYHLFGRFWRADWPRFLAIFRLGLPIATTLLFETALFSGAGLAMGWIGEAALAGHTIALQLVSLCFMVPLGLGQAATIRVGRANGAGDPGGVTRAGWSVFTLAVGFEAITGTLLLTIPGLLVRLFLDVNLPGADEVYAQAIAFLRVGALFQLADGAQVVLSGMLRGLKDTRGPMIRAAIGYWGIGAPLGLALAFPLGLGGVGLWSGLAFGLGTVALMLLQRWLGRERRTGIRSPAG